MSKITAKEALAKIKELIGFTAQKFEAVMTISGDQLKWEGDLAVGTTLVLISEEGELPAPTGSYELEDGRVLNVEDGAVTEIVEVAVVEEPVAEFAIEWEGDLAVGVSVTMNGEVAPDGEYEIEDGRIVVVAGGVVTEIKDAPVAVVEEELSAEDIDSLFEWLFGFKKDFAEMKSENIKLKGEIVSMKAQVKELKESPAADPIPKMFGKTTKEKLSQKEAVLEAVRNRKK
jgi:hypothetical protein